MKYTWEIVQILFYLLLVIALIYLAAKLFRRRVFRGGGGRHLQNLERMYFAPDKFLSLVRVKDRVILFSIGEENINEIREWPLEEFEDLNMDNGDRTSFSGYLKKYIDKYRRDDR
ncbi:MAG: FliO/MopB family protein [Bacillota bacterium]